MMRCACPILLGLGTVVLLSTGCQNTPEAYKAEADRFVYHTVDAKWDARFGAKPSYDLDEPRLPRDPNALAVMLPEDGRMSLPLAVAIALANNREYQLQKESLYVSALELRLVQHVFEPNPFTLLGAGYAETERRKNDWIIDKDKAYAAPGMGEVMRQGDIGFEETDVVFDIDEVTQESTERKYGLESDIGFRQVLSTGARISARVAMGWLQILSGDVDDGLSTIISATISQPLLRGAGREIVLEQLTQAERNVLYEIRAFNRFRQQLVVDVISQYYRTLQLADNLDNARANLANLDDIYAKMKALAGVGKLARHELEEAEQERLDARDAVYKAEREYTQALDDLKLLLALPPQMAFTLDPAELERLRTHTIDELGLAEAEAVAAAQVYRLDLANRIDTVIDAERKVKVALDRTRMELNLVATANKDVAERESFGALLGVVTAEDTFRIGVEMDLPLDRLPEKNDYRLSLIALDQARRAEEELRDNIIAEVRRAYRDLREAHRRYAVQTEGYGLAKRRLNNTLQLLQYQRANVRDVLRAQRDFYQARLEATDAVVDFTVALMAFYRDTGLLQVRPDGSWANGLARLRPAATPPTSAMPSSAVPAAPVTTQPASDG